MQIYVCKDWFPMNGDWRSESGFPINEMLKQQLDVLLKNITHDWNFTILISGRGEMRVGKSLLGMQIAIYWTYMLEKLYKIKIPFTIKDNMVLNGNELIIKGKRLGTKHKYSVLDYDEAADDLEGTKVMRTSVQATKDWLRKCAQYNMLTILIQSEFFEVPKPIAISRSTCLIDVYYTADDDGMFKRGYFRFFSRRQKKYLYLKGKKFLDYECVKPDFRGTFANFYPVNEEEYRKEKYDSLKRWEKYTGQDIRRQEWIKATLKVLYAQGLSYREIADKINEVSTIKISHWTVSKLLGGEDLGLEDEEIS